MSEEKDIFTKIIEEKVKNFEVPYNPSHWSEMSEKLDAVKPTPEIPKSSGVFRKLFWAGTAAIAVIGAWLIYSQDEEITSYSTTGNEIENVESPQQQPNATIEEKIVESSPIITEDNSADEEILPVEEEVEKSVQADSKIEKYADRTEKEIKEESENFVAEMEKEQKSSFGPEPRLNNSALKTDIVITDDNLCVSDNVKFGISKEIEGAKYYWNFGDNGLTSRKPYPKHKFKKAGTYVVTLIVAKGEIGEKNDYKSEKTVVIKEKPTFVADAVKKDITLNDPYANLFVTSNSNCDIKWYFNNKEIAQGKSMDLLIPQAGVYTVSIKATAENGCIAQEVFDHSETKGVKMIVEDAFTPNNDGINDVFIPQELTISEVNFTFVVRNKDGQVVYSTEDKYQPWNGSLNNAGNTLPSETYFWKVTFTDDRGKIHNQEGKIKLQPY